MNNVEFSQLILNDHARIEKAITTGAAWEIWFQVECVVLLMNAGLQAAREVPYPRPHQAMHLDVLARHDLEDYAIELKVESATNAGKKLLPEVKKDILKLEKYSASVHARWVAALAYSDEAKRYLREFTEEHKGSVIYHERGAIGCMIASV
jgi:hypothetical protein